jgi:seryl-tRNA synthetase
MSKKKGLSMEEKCKKVLELFSESEDVFQLKEIEKMAPSKKGVISQSVKDCITQLVADNLLETDKIGSSTYFWSFSRKLVTEKQKKRNQFKQQVLELQKRRSVLRKQIKASSMTEEERSRCAKYAKRIARKKEKITELKAELDKFKDCDPDQVNQLKEQCDTAVEAAERWTTNIFSIRKWVRDKTAMSESDVNKQFGIPDDFDYIDDEDDE